MKPKKPVVSVQAYEHRKLRAVALIFRAKDARGERIMREITAQMLRKATA